MEYAASTSQGLIDDVFVVVAVVVPFPRLAKTTVTLSRLANIMHDPGHASRSHCTFVFHIGRSCEFTELLQRGAVFEDR
jgi:hypothetical protein